MCKSLNIFTAVFLLSFFSPVKPAAQLSKEFLASLPDKIKLSSPGKILTVREKWTLINNFRSGTNNQKQFIPVYDSIASSLCRDFDTAKHLDVKINIGKNLTSFYNLTADYTKSLFYTNEILKLPIANDSFPYLKIGHQRLKGTLLSKLRRQEEAIDFINGALDESIAAKDTFGTGMLYYAMATIYTTINLPETAITYTDSALYYYELLPKKDKDVDNMYSEATGLKFLQTFSLFEQNNDTAYLKNLRDIISLSSSKKITRPFFIVFPIIEAYSKNEYATAIERCDSFLRKSNQTKLSVNDYIGLIVTKYKALSLYKSGKQREGVELLENPVQEILANPTKDDGLARLRLPFIYTTSQLLQDFYKSSNNWSKAYQYLAISKAARDTLDFISNQGKIFEANQKFNFAKKEIKVQELEKDNAIKKRQRNFALYLSIISLLSFIIIASFLYNRYRHIKLKKKIAEQDAQNKIDRLNITTQLQIAELEDKNSIARQEEQKRLGLELHDELAGDMAFLKSKIELAILELANENTATNLKEISSYTSNIYQKVRNKSHSWYHAITEESDSSFKKRIQTLINNGLPDHKYKKELLLDDDALRLLPMNVKIEIVYILQEALTNIIKHAKATEVSVHMYEDISGVVVQVSDNGNGFNTTSSKKGLGLQSMENRVKQINGKLVMHSGRTGTEIHITIPPGSLLPGQ